MAGLTLYVESSAVLAWLLGEAKGGRVAKALRDAHRVIASDLTLVECERVLIRGWSSGLMTEAQRIDQSSVLALTARHWIVLRMSDEVIERARRPFPLEPVRTLDALHLASALMARSAAPGLRVLTLDQRVRENAQRLGLETLP
jgi:predicted nucleic acid-binding protein